MSKVRGYAIGLMSGVLWAVYSVLSSVVGSMEPYSSLSGVLVPAFLISLVVALTSSISCVAIIVVKGKFRTLYKSLITKESLLLAVAGILAGPLAMVCYTISVNSVGAGVASTITSMYPVLGLIIAVALRKESCSAKKVLGVIVVTLGVILVSYSPSETKFDNLGIILALIAALGWSLEGIIGSTAMEKLDYDISITIRQIMSLLFHIMIIPIICTKSDLLQVTSSTLSNSTLVLIVAGVVATLSYFLWYKSLNDLEVSTAMILNVSYAGWAVLLQVIVYRELPSAISVLGTLLVILGTSKIIKLSYDSYN